MPSAVALNQVLWQTVGIAGSALGGLLIARFGFGAAYAIDLVDVRSAVLRRVPDASDAAGSTSRVARPAGRRSRRGSRSSAGTDLLQSTFVIDLIAMIFGMPQALFTFLAITQFHRGPEVVGLLFAAPAVGAFVGALTAGWVKQRPASRDGRHLGRGGVGRCHHRLRAGGRPPRRWRCSSWRSRCCRRHLGHLPEHDHAAQTPDSLRGRMSQIYILVVAGGPRLGDFEAGLVATCVHPDDLGRVGRARVHRGRRAWSRSSIPSFATIASTTPPDIQFRAWRRSPTTSGPRWTHRPRPDVADAVRMVELRVLEGPNLYFTRPAIKLTLAVPGWLRRATSGSCAIAERARRARRRKDRAARERAATSRGGADGGVPDAPDRRGRRSATARGARTSGAGTRPDRRGVPVAPARRRRGARRTRSPRG